MKRILLLLFLLAGISATAQETITYNGEKDKLYKRLTERYIGPVYQEELDRFYKVSCDSMVNAGIEVQGEPIKSLLVKFFLACEIELDKKTISRLRVPSTNEAFLEMVRITGKKPVIDLYRTLGLNRTRILYTTFKDLPVGDSIKTFMQIREITYNPLLIPDRIAKPEFAPWRDTMVYYLANVDPNFYLNELKNNTYINELAAAHQNKTVKAVTALKDQENITEILPFGMAIYENRIKPEAVSAMISKPATYYAAFTQELIDLNQSDEQQKRDYLQDYVDDLNAVLSEYYVTPINELHEQPDNVRYKILNGISSKDLYFTILGGGSSFYTSSFLYVFNKFLAATEKEGLDAFFERTGYYRFGEFLTTVSGYGLLGKLVGKMNDQKFSDALVGYMSKMIRSQMTDRELILHGMSLSEIFYGVRSNQKIKDNLLAKLSDLSRSTDRTNIFLQRMYMGFGDILTGAEDTKLVEVEKLYEVLPVDRLKKKDTIVQAALFYDDVDGTASYANFMQIYSGKEWSKEDKGNYLILRSTAGNPMVIYCNKPNTKVKDNAAQDEMLKAISDAGEVVTSFLHRGHSYHLFKSLRKLPASAEFVYLGSCGGYNDVSKVFFANPDAHIISTRGIGSKYVNDPILSKVTAEVLANKDLEWNELWKGFAADITNKTAKDLFNSYIPPNKYIGIMFIREVFNF